MYKMADITALFGVGIDREGIRLVYFFLCDVRFEKGSREELFSWCGISFVHRERFVHLQKYIWRT